MVMRRLCVAALAAMLAAGGLVDTSRAQDTPRPETEQQQPGAQQPGEQRPGEQRPGEQQRGIERDRERPDTARIDHDHEQDQQLDDRYLAQWLIVGSQVEVALGRMAHERSQNPEVQQFAQRMVQDHAEKIEQLQQIARGEGDHERRPDAIQRRAERDAPQRQPQPDAERDRFETDQDDPTDAPRQPDAQRQPGAQPDAQRQPGAQPDAQRQPGAQQDAQRDRFEQQDDPAQRQPDAIQRERQVEDVDREDRDQRHASLLKFKQEVGEQYVQSLTEAFEQKEGAEFDKAYLGHQIISHVKMLDTLTVAEKYATSELQQLISQHRETANDHLEQAKQLVQEVDKRELDDRQPQDRELQERQPQDRELQERQPQDRELEDPTGV